MNSVKERNKILKDLVEEVRKFKDYHREQEMKTANLLEKIEQEFELNSSKLEDRYMNFLYILKELVYLSECINNTQYRTKVSKGKIVSDINYSYKFIDSNNVMLPYEFLEMCKKYEVIEGKSKEHYKPVNYNGKIIRSYVFNTEKINELLEEMNM